MKEIEGARDVAMEQIAGESQLVVKPNRRALSRYGLAVGDVMELVREGWEVPVPARSSMATSVTTSTCGSPSGFAKTVKPLPICAYRPRQVLGTPRGCGGSQYRIWTTAGTS